MIIKLDNKITAVNIAKEAGILEESYEDTEGSFKVMTGKEFREYVFIFNIK